MTMSNGQGLGQCSLRGQGRVYLAQPTYASGSPASYRAFWIGGLKPTSTFQGRLTAVYGGHSLLAHGFNQHWTNALNLQLDNEWQNWKVEDVSVGECAQWSVTNVRLGVPPAHFPDRGSAYLYVGRAQRLEQIDYFGMLHDDVVPEDGWLDILLEDLIRYDADVVSAVIPIKDGLGVTSTAIDDPTDWNVLRRLTMKEVDRLPEVFSAKDCGYPDNALLPNTGCWICRFDRPWRNAMDPQTNTLKICFNIQDRIYLKDMGPDKGGVRYASDVRPEDWNFGRQLHALNCKVLCTKRVKLVHQGRSDYPNQGSWGLWATDQAFLEKTRGVPVCPTPTRPDQSQPEQSQQSHKVPSVPDGVFNETVLQEQGV